MLQYFIDKKYKPSLSHACEPKLEYICNVDESSSSMPRTMHIHKDLIEILLVYSGTGIYVIENKRYTAKKGDLIFYNSGVVHDEFGGSGNDLCTYCLAVSNLKLTNLDKNKIIPDNYLPVIDSKEYFPELINMFEMIAHNISIKDKRAAEINNYLAKAFIVKTCSIIERYGKINEDENNESSLVIKIKSYIDVHYKEDISINSIASAMRLSRYYVSRIFKKHTGFSPMQYIIRRRLGEAQNLLINTDMSITQIAISVGYNDSNYFQNVFRQNVGYTPGNYRKKWKL